MLTSVASARNVPEPPDIEFCRSRTGLPVVRLGGRYIHSPYDPVREAEQWARAVAESGEERGDRNYADMPSLWVVFGAGLGYHLEALAKKGGGKVVAFEPDERLLRSGRTRRLPARVEVHTDLAEVREAFRRHYPSAGRTRVVELPAYGEIFPALCGEFNRVVQAVRNEIRADSMTYVMYGADWVLQSIENVPALVESSTVDELYGSGKGRAAVIVSPGPSLERNIDVLAANRGKFLVVAPSQSLKALVAAGIEPDVVVVVDSQNLKYHFEGCPPSSYRNLVLALKCHPDVVSLPAERKFFFHMTYNTLASEVFRFLRGNPCNLVSGYSVSNTAFSLAHEMGCNPIVLVGQDLAFTGGRVYASGAIDGSARVEVDEKSGAVRFADFGTKLRLADGADAEALRRRLSQAQTLVWLEGADGSRLPTTQSMAAMHAWFEKRAASLKGVRLINATEGGALIRGMEHLPLAEVAGGLSEQQPWTPPGTGHDGDAERLSQILQGLAGRCAELASTAAKADREAARILKLGRAADASRLARLQKLERKMLKLIEKLRVVDAMVQAHLSRFRRESKRAGQDIVENLKVSRTLYGGVREAAETLREGLLKACGQGGR